MTRPMRKESNVMINLDQPEYRELAARITLYRDEGRSWADSQRIALADMARRGWRPS